MIAWLKRLLRPRNTDAEFAAAWAQIERDRALELRAANLGLGRWVPSDGMNPFTNVSGRLYRTRDGSIHRFHDYTLARGHDIEAWFSPSVDAMPR